MMKAKGTRGFVVATYLATTSSVFYSHRHEFVTTLGNCLDIVHFAVGVCSFFYPFAHKNILAKSERLYTCVHSRVLYH